MKTAWIFLLIGWVATTAISEEPPSTPRDIFNQYFRLMDAGETDAAKNLKAADCNDTLHMKLANKNYPRQLKPFYQLTTPVQALVVTQPFDILDRKEVIYATFKKQDANWRIQQLARAFPDEADWLMQGFQLHANVDLDLSQRALTGEWSAVCASTIILNADGTGSEFLVGPAGPAEGQQPEPFTWTISGSTLDRAFNDRKDRLVVESIDHQGVYFETPNPTHWGGWRRETPKAAAKDK